MKVRCLQLLAVSATTCNVVLGYGDMGKRPNIVMVVVDDWGWNNWGVHAKGQANEAEVVTPNLDALAADGIILDRYYAPKLCGPSRNSMFTGRNGVHNSCANGLMGEMNMDDPVSGYEGSSLKMTFVSEKLQSAGYATAMFGKWDTGQATQNHYPNKRGFDHSLTYQSFSNDPWTYRTGPPLNDEAGPGTPSFGLCNTDPELYNGEVYHNINYRDMWENEGPAFRFEPADECSVNNQAGCLHEDHLFRNEAINFIEQHNADQPLFLVLSTHGIHTPLSPLSEYSDNFSFITDEDDSQYAIDRKNYAGYVQQEDEVIGAVADAIKDKGIWEDTLFVVFSDNGGPIYLAGVRGPPGQTQLSPTGGANNFPLKGGKFSNYEGGIRVNAFVSGGYVPSEQRGTTRDGLVATEDWYATFCDLAGVDPTDEVAERYNIPPIDSISAWDYLSGASEESARREVWGIGATPYPGIRGGECQVQSLTNSDGYKLLTGLTTDGIWTGPFYPNGTTDWNQGTDVNVCSGAVDPRYRVYDPATQTFDASGGCLFNVFADPTEHSPLDVSDPVNYAIMQELSARMEEVSLTKFNPDRGVPSNIPCKGVIDELYSGYLGPWIPVIDNDSECDGK